MNSDSEIRKHAHMKANEQTVQVKQCDVPHILLIVYYLEDYMILTLVLEKSPTV